MQPLLVSQLNVYPVKSLGGFEVNSTEVFSKGLALDRRWMLVDENNCFLTQRQAPQMVLFSTSPDGETGQVIVHFQGETLLIPKEIQGEALETGIWDDRVEVVKLEPVFGEWFSQRIGFTCSLVAFPEENPRPVDPDFAIYPSNQTSLSDGYPILIIGQSSLDDLNARLVEPLPMNRFRPNIVFTGGQPFEEDTWKKFSIGKVAMKGVKPCARCMITTIDQQTGLAGKEPLATLNSYRKVGNKVLFGQNVIPLNQGVISVGDEILVG